jgi:magnesium transporter
MVKRYNVIDQRMKEVHEDPCPVYVYVNPDEGEKRYLIDTLKIDEHTLHSALDPDELSRLEFEPDHTAIIFKRPKSYSFQDQFVFKVASTGLFVFKDRLVIVISEDVPVFEGATPTRSCTPGYLMLRTIYRSIFHFLEHLKVISSISDQLQDKINQSMENRYLINLFTLEKSLVYYLNFINSNTVLLEKIRLNAPKFGFTVEEAELLEDTLIENNQCYRQAEIYSNILASLMDARASIVSNNINVLVKTLNIITIGIMVPTLVVSIFSMNVVLPLAQEARGSFWVILGLAGASMAGVAYLWRRKRW